MAFNQSLLHVSRPLTDLVVSYDPGTDGYLRSKFFPRKPVDHMTNLIRQISKPDLLRLYDGLSGSDQLSGATEVQFRTAADLSYTCKPFALSAILDELDSKNADSELAYEQRTAMQLATSMQVALEKFAIKDTLRSTSIMTSYTSLTSGQRWDNYTSTSSSPLDDLLAAKELIASNTGKDPNILAMSNWTWKALVQHPSVINRVVFNTNGTGAILTKKILADILGMNESQIYIYNHVYNSAQQGETASYKNFFGSDTVMAYLDAPSLYSYGLGHEFSFSGFTSDPMAVLRFPMPQRGIAGADMLKAVSIVDFKVLVPEAGYLIKGCLNTSDSQYGGYVD